ncbi:MAG: hypothetical protein QOJ03_28, partial [Frankiaceae bacterium]|nr:hypothetical protein [Frankiaceae bacterium]
NDDGCGQPAGRSRLVLAAVAGTTYRIAVDSTDYELRITLKLRAAVPPANDDFAAAVTLSGDLPIGGTGTNVDATLESGEPPINAQDSTVWYSWTPSSSGPVVIDACGSEIVADIDVYSGAALNALVAVATGHSSGCGRVAATFDAVAGTRYDFRVGGRFGAVGAFQLHIDNGPTRPANDDFASAQVLDGPLPLTVTGANVGATAEASDPSPAGAPGGRSVWYEWTPTEAVIVTVETCNSNFDTLLGVYSGDDIGSLTPIAESDDNCTAFSSFQSKVAFGAVPGTTYHLMIDGYRGATGAITLGIRPSTAPANDLFAEAQPLSGQLPIVVPADNIEATAEVGEPQHAGEPAHSSVWYRWTPDTSVVVVIDTCETGVFFDSRLEVYVGDSIDALTPVQSNDDACGFGASQVVFPATAGTTYMIAVDGYGYEGYLSENSNDQGHFTLTLGASDGPTNDFFESATTIDGPLPLRVDGTAAGSTRETGEPELSPFPETIFPTSIWYQWTPSTDAAVTIDTCGSQDASFLGVFTGDAVDELASVAPAGPACGEQHAVTFAAIAGTTYEIVVGGGSSATTLNVHPASRPANDLFANAQPLTGRLPIEIASSNVDATFEAGEPDHAGNPGGSSIWFNWRAPVSGFVSADLCNSALGPNALIGVYTGSTVDALTPVVARDGGIRGCGFNNFAAVVWNATAGTTYRIAVDGYSGQQGAVDLVLRRALTPANDDFANAVPLRAALPINVRAQNVDASHEQGEPADYTGSGAGASVWYSWTPATSGPVVLETCGSPLPHALVGVWTGPRVDALAPVYGTSVSCENGDTSLTIAVQAGTTYHIAVDGSFSTTTQGDITLRLRSIAPPANDNLAHATTLSSRLPMSVRGTNRDATAEVNELGHSNVFDDAGGSTVWYRWTAPASGLVTVDTCAGRAGAGVESDTNLAVYTGDAMLSLEEIAVAWYDSCGRGVHVSFDAVAGTTYKIVVGGTHGHQEPFTLGMHWAHAPANDDHGSATRIGPKLPVSINGSNIDATDEPQGFLPATEVWYSWIAPRTERVVAETCATTSMSTHVAVVAGRPSDDVTEEVPNTTARCGEYGESVSFDAVAGASYRIAVGGATYLSQGNFRLTLRTVRPPANDAFANAEVIRGSLPNTVRGSNVDATRETGEPFHAIQGHDHSVWYRWTPKTSGLVTIDTCGSDMGTLLAVYTGTAVADLHRVASGGADAYACGGSKLTFSVVAGTTYSIAVDSAVQFGPVSAEVGDVVLHFTCAGSCEKPRPTVS